MNNKLCSILKQNRVSINKYYSYYDFLKYCNENVINEVRYLLNGIKFIVKFMGILKYMLIIILSI